MRVGEDLILERLAAAGALTDITGSARPAIIEH